METITTHFLFSLSLLIILLFLHLSLPMKFGFIHLRKQVSLSYVVLSLLVCYLFSYPLTDDFTLDLRIIPFLIGGLYLRLSPLLGFLIIFLRGFHGIDDGFLLDIQFYAIFSFFIWIISPWFLKLTSKNRILFSTGITLIISLGILVLAVNLLPSKYLLDMFVAYIIVAPLGIAMISYAIEMLEHNIHLQQQLVITEKQDAIEQMGAAISHEIRNPLTTAIGFVELLNKNSLDKEKRVQYLSILKHELDSAEAIIQDYITFSKPILKSTEVLNIQKELTHVLKLLQPLANYHSVKIITHFSNYGTIEGDQSKFHQCFINIIKHCIESMPCGGTLSINTMAKRSKIIITIQDTGKGLNEDQIKQLGEPFYTTKDSAETGLGMMVAYSILRAMKGTMDVKSEINKGTIYQIEI